MCVCVCERERKRAYPQQRSGEAGGPASGQVKGYLTYKKHLLSLGPPHGQTFDYNAAARYYESRSANKGGAHEVR